MFENFSFDNLLQPKNLMAGGGMLAQMGQGMQNGGGLLGGMSAMQGGGLLSALQNKETLDMLKKLLAQRSGAANPFPTTGGVLGPWAGNL